jgi:hypothetical protein
VAIRLIGRFLVAFPGRCLLFLRKRRMKSDNQTDRDVLQRQLGARDERVRVLESELANRINQYKADALEWQSLQQHRRDLADWVVDGATDEIGIVVKQIIDARLGGEPFVPCSFSTSANGRNYRIDLVSTKYEVREVGCNG